MATNIAPYSSRYPRAQTKEDPALSLSLSAFNKAHGIEYTVTDLWTLWCMRFERKWAAGVESEPFWFDVARVLLNNNLLFEQHTFRADRLEPVVTYKLRDLPPWLSKKVNECKS